jgi:hypothetical protein
MFCYGAGNDDAAHFVIERETHLTIAKEGATTVKNAAYLYSQNQAALCKERAERTNLSHLGLDSKSFVSNQKMMNTKLVLEIDRRMKDFRLGVWAIVAGVDSGENPGRHIYLIDDSGCVFCCDKEGFCAIGTGNRQFETMFLLSSFDKSWPLLETALLMYSAKKAAEASPGVGSQETDMFVADSNNCAPVMREDVEAIGQYYERLKDETKKARKEVLEKMVKDGVNVRCMKTH